MQKYMYFRYFSWILNYQFVTSEKYKFNSQLFAKNKVMHICKTNALIYFDIATEKCRFRV